MTNDDMFEAIRNAIRGHCAFDPIARKHLITGLTSMEHSGLYSSFTERELFRDAVYDGVAYVIDHDWTDDHAPFSDDPEDMRRRVLDVFFQQAEYGYEIIPTGTVPLFAVSDYWDENDRPDAGEFLQSCSTPELRMFCCRFVGSGTEPDLDIPATMLPPERRIDVQGGALFMCETLASAGSTLLIDTVLQPEKVGWNKPFIWVFSRETSNLMAEEYKLTRAITSV